MKNITTIPRFEDSKIFRLFVSFNLLILVSLILMFAGCKKGDTGAQGPQGPEGNANVLSNVYQINSWTSFTFDNVIYLQAAVDDANITQDIVDNGAVLVFECSNIQTENWIALPYTEPTGLNNITTSFNFIHSLGLVTISLNNSDGSDPGIPGTMYVKVIVISGTAMSAHPNVNLKNYQEVKTTFNVQEKLPMN